MVEQLVESENDKSIYLELVAGSDWKKLLTNKDLNQKELKVQNIQSLTVGTLLWLENSSYLDHCSGCHHIEV